MKTRVDYEARFYEALKRITAYMTTDQLRRRSEKTYGLPYEEALEMAYENVLDEAQAALSGYRKKRPKPATSVGAVDPHAGSTGKPPTRVSQSSPSASDFLVGGEPPPAPAPESTK